VYKSLWMLLLNPLVCASLSWFCVKYSKFQIKITQPVSRMYQDHLLSSFDHSILSSFYFPRYVSSFINFSPGFSVLDPYHCAQLYECPFLINAPAEFLTRLTGHLRHSYKTKVDTFPSLLLRGKAFPFLDSLFISFSFRIRNLNHAISLPP
jgi:hypothetical protein